MWISLVFLLSKKFASNSPRETINQNKHKVLIHTWSYTDFKGTVVNQTLPSLHGG